MLQKTTAFRPLMQEFISLLCIAGRTRNYQIRGVICSTTRQWHNVFNVISTSACSQLLFAIIAFILLLFKHTFDIISIMIPPCLYLAGASSVLHSLVRFQPTRRLLIPHFIFACLFRVFFLPLCYSLQDRRLIFFIPDYTLRWIGWFTWLHSTFAIILLRNFSTTCMAIVRKFITCRLVIAKELRCWRVKFITFTTSFLTIDITFTWLSAFTKTVLATRLQVVRHLFVFIEELKCSGVFLITKSASLLRQWRSIIHDLNCLSFSALFFVARVARQPPFCAG
jgi:hypothetical protein